MCTLNYISDDAVNSAEKELELPEGARQPPNEEFQAVVKEKLKGKAIFMSLYQPNSQIATSVLENARKLQRLAAVNKKASSKSASNAKKKDRRA